MKTCTKCQEEKPLSEFYFEKNKNRHQARCKKCRIEYQLDRQKNDPRYKVTHRRARLKHLYGVTPEWYDETLAAQGGHCAICPSTIPGRAGVEFFSVDHDHADGRVRGLLCLRCNSSLGWHEGHKEAIDKYLSVS